MSIYLIKQDLIELISVYLEMSSEIQIGFGFLVLHCCRARRPTQAFSESRHPPRPTKHGFFARVQNSPTQTMQSKKDFLLFSRHQKRSSLSQKQYQNFQPGGFQYKNSNFEFSSGWNTSGSDYYDNSEPPESVTEMTDEKLQELGFPVPPSPDTDHGSHLPPPSVIDNPFFHIVSRKYHYVW